MFEPSKGGSSLAQSFLQNKATQPTQQIGQINQPQAQGLPAPIQQPATLPVMGQIAPTQQGPISLGRGAIWDNGKVRYDGSGPDSPGHMQSMAMIRGRALADERGLSLPGMPQQAAPVGAPQLSTAQLLARAINERAQRRGS